MASETANSATLTELQHLSKQHPGIPILTPSSPDFQAVRACFVKRDADAPLAIARPQTPEDVQTLVRYCIANGLDFVVRSGGHDCAGRSQVRGALTIDMRAIKHVRVADDRQTATVGGGILIRDLASELDARGLVTPV